MNCDVPHGRGKMVKSNGNARYGRWEKGIYQKAPNETNQRGPPLNEINEQVANEEGPQDEASKVNTQPEQISIFKI